MLDKLFKTVLYVSGIILIILIGSMFVTLSLHSRVVFKHFGLMSFIKGKEWNPVAEQFGAFPFIAGTLITSFLALIISLPFSLATGLFTGEYLKDNILGTILTYVSDLLSGIPSIIYGFWGLFFLVPLVRKIELRTGIVPYGVGIMTASIILAIMIIPYTSSISREVIKLVPSELKEAAYSLGATRYEVIRHVILPYSRSGIFVGILLSLGRGLGETMAVTMVIGNANVFPKSLFSPANTMASVIANEFTEATSDLHLSALIAIGLLLFVITFFINMVGQIIIKRFMIDEIHI